MTKKRVAVLVSGSGSNLQALIDASAAADYPAQIALVISNRDDAYGLTRARNAGIATHVISHKDFESREAFDAAMDAVMTQHQVEFICLAGFMRVLSPWFVEKWQGKMINIHPSLLPKYKGLHTHERAIEAGDKEAGCTVHWVSAGVDEGEIIAQASVPILAGDTPETLADRVLAEEHKIYPAALKRIAQAT
ncbi:MAG: phosphoribosylglycinamide formyltransferase [Alphaproteobacteria bacterium]|nr:phosphoribosylglycinamide formyltransferase [Alphaproteobacteria bacterium]